MLPSMGAKNAAAARKWKFLSEDERCKYNEEAAAINSGC